MTPYENVVNRRMRPKMPRRPMEPTDPGFYRDAWKGTTYDRPTFDHPMGMARPTQGGWNNPLEQPEPRLRDPGFNPGIRTGGGRPGPAPEQHGPQFAPPSFETLQSIQGLGNQIPQIVSLVAKLRAAWGNDFSKWPGNEQPRPNPGLGGRRQFPNRDRQHGPTRM